MAAGLAEAVKEYTEQGVEEDWMAFLLRTRPTFMDGKDAFEKEYLGKMSPSRHIEQIETSQMAISRKLNGTVKNLQIGETTFLEEALRGYWLSSFERDFEGDTVVYFFNHPELKKAALEKLKKPDSEGLFKTLLYAALHSDNNFELAVALQMIAQHCEENSDPRRLWKAIRALQEANPEDASKLFLLFSFFKDARVQMLRVLEAAKGEDNAFEIQVHKDEAKLTLKGDWRFFDPDVLDHFHQNLLSTDASSGAVGREVEAITMEGIPAAEKLWQEIRERRSITLGETQEIDLRDVLPSSWHIFISPKTGMEAYSLTIRVVKQINGKVKHVEIKGKLDHSGFKSGVVLPTELAAKIHSVGSLAAHRYFVREMEKEVGARVKERKATITGEDADGKKEEEVAVPLKGARIGNDTLTIDLTEKDKTADRERQARTQARIGRSNQVLRKHLNKLDLSDEELEELMLFIPSESPVRGKKVYDLITDLERKKEFLKEGLEGKNL